MIRDLKHNKIHKTICCSLIVIFLFCIFYFFFYFFSLVKEKSSGRTEDRRIEKFLDHSEIELKNTDIFLINLKSNKERLEYFINEYMHSDIRHKKFKRFDAINGLDLDLPEYVTNTALAEIQNAEATGYRSKHYMLTRGGVGCYLSHLGVYKLIAGGDKDFGMIFEDDVNIDPRLMHKLNHVMHTIPSNWDILLLGCWCAICNPLETYYESKKFYFLHAYVVRKSAALKMVELLSSKKITQQIDSQLSDLAGDGKLEIICLKDSISTQSVVFPTTIQVPIKKIEGVNAFARPL